MMTEGPDRAERARDEFCLQLTDRLLRQATVASLKVGAVDSGLAFLRAGLATIAGSVGAEQTMQLVIEEAQAMLGPPTAGSA